PPRAARSRIRGVDRRRTAARLPAAARTAPGGRRLADTVPALLVRSRRLSRTAPRADGPIDPNAKEDKETTMTVREQYTPSPATGAQVEKNGETWTLVLVRELRHAPETVWQALTDPVHLREWAPFDADRSLGTVGTTARLTTIGAPSPHVTETTVTRADAPKLLEYNWGGHD